MPSGGTEGQKEHGKEEIYSSRSLTRSLILYVCAPTADSRQFHPVVSCCSTHRSLFSGGEVDCGESPAWRVSPPEVFRPTGLEIELRVVNRVPRSAHAKIYGPLVRRPNGVSQRVGRRQVPWPSKLITCVLKVPRLGYLGTANHIVFLSLNVHGGAPVRGSIQVMAPPTGRAATSRSDIDMAPYENRAHCLPQPRRMQACTIPRTAAPGPWVLSPDPTHCPQAEHPGRCPPGCST